MSNWLCQTTPTLTPGGTRQMAALWPLAADAELTRQCEAVASLTELPLFCFEAETGVLVWQSDAELLPFCPMERRFRLGDVTDVEILTDADGLAYFLFSLPGTTAAGRYIIGGYGLTDRQARPQSLVLEAVAAHWSGAQLDQLLSRLPICSERMLGRMLQLAVDAFRQQDRLHKVGQECAQLHKRVAIRNEEIHLLHELVQKLQLSNSAEELAVQCIKRLHHLIDAAGHAICLQASEDHVQFLVEGRLPFDETSLARLLSRFDHHDWSQPLVKNHLQQSLLGADFPGLKNLVVAPIGEGRSRRGWILSVNAGFGRDFEAGDAQLLASIAAIICTHVRNVETYSKHDELLLSFVRSLVSTLDAKDPYTRGHSERVALIARKLGEHLQLPESDLDDIYLSGLLHDLGKVGIDDRVLRKPDQLTDEEFQHIQQHPMIGFQILSQLKSLHQILPGVRSHHEAINGKGYPDRLRGDEIPLMARIIAVADAYDAMCSDRPYRKGVPVAKLEEIFQKGSGEQWDSRVIDAYFAVRDEIFTLCANYSPADGNLLKERIVERASGITVRTFLRY